VPTPKENRRAGQPGLEPGTLGFGDRCAANYATDPNIFIISQNFSNSLHTFWVGENGIEN
jgi:hypothetical protein